MVTVRSVVGEEAQLRSAEERLFNTADANHHILPVQVGLLIGKLYPNMDRGFVYHLLPTPPTDSGLPACSVPDVAIPRHDNRKNKKPPKSEAPVPLAIDTEWVAEHARQVSRMLLGGMQVVGIYIWASENSFKASTPILCQTIKAVAQTSPFYDSDLGERLLIHISYSPRRWACRNCSLTSSDTTSNLRPCDFKMGKLLGSLQNFRCTYDFEIRLPIFHEASKSDTFRDVLQVGISCLAKELKSAKALVDGNLVTEDLQCTSEGPHEVELILPFMKGSQSELFRPGEVVGVVVFSGVICASAYLVSKVPISQAVNDIKGDILSSLQSRLDIICEDLEGEVGLPNNVGEEMMEDISFKKPESQLILHELRKYCDLVFPKRLLVPWLPGFFICDYLKQSDTFEDLKDHCKEMLSLEVSADEETILEPEKEAKAMTGKSFWKAVPGNSASPVDYLKKDVNYLEGVKESGQPKGQNIYILISIVFLLLSVLAGWFVANFGGKENIR